MKRLILSSVLALTMALSVGASTAASQNNSQQIGLVNISLGNVEVLNNVNLAVAAQVVAAVCGNPITVGVLATQVINQEGATTMCTSEAGALKIDQALNGPRDTPPNAGGNNSRQAGLVNISTGDVEILNDVNLAVAAQVVATVCGNPITAAVLAVQLINQGGSTTFCEAGAGPLTVTQQN